MGGRRRSTGALPCPKSPSSSQRSAFCTQRVSPATRAATVFQHRPSNTHLLPWDNALPKRKSRFFVRMSPCVWMRSSAARHPRSLAQLKQAGDLLQTG